jgi:hypothetical protein
MKRQFFTLFTAGVFCASLTAGAFAAGPPAADTAAKDRLISKLEQRAHALDWDAQGTKGVPRARLEQRSLRVKKLIERLKAGETVDPQEIDKLLQQGLP